MVDSESQAWNAEQPELELCDGVQSFCPLPQPGTADLWKRCRWRIANSGHKIEPNDQNQTSFCDGWEPGTYLTAREGVDHRRNRVAQAPNPEQPSRALRAASSVVMITVGSRS